ncbi:MAG TPA: M14 family metallopeptidase [Anaerolineaceae bacterium]|nr:M14 family metallopeptidase [Anaerolineaceae bacterium]
MSTDLIVGSLTARPGEKITGSCRFDVSGQPYELPVYLINGAGSGPTLVLTAGIHAAEYASIAAALELGQTLDPAGLNGQVIIVPVVNQPGFSARSIYVNPMDGVNLNRVFPGNPDGGPTEQIAAWLFNNVIRQADYYIDMHGGDLVEALVPFTLFPEVGQPELDMASLEMAQMFGIPYLVRKPGGFGSTFSAAAGAGIPALLVESGGQGRWPRESVTLLIDGVHRVMRRYGMTPGGPVEPVETVVLKNFLWLRSEHAGFWYPAVEVGQAVTRGQPLGEVRDVWGRCLQTAQSPADGRVLFLVTSLAMNAGDPLLSVGA